MFYYKWLIVVVVVVVFTFFLVVDRRLRKFPSEKFEGLHLTIEDDVTPMDVDRPIETTLGIQLNSSRDLLLVSQLVDVHRNSFVLETPTSTSIFHLPRNDDEREFPPRLVRLDSKRIFLMVDQREFLLIDLFSDERIILEHPSIGDASPLVKNKELFLIDSFQPFSVVQCSLRQHRCRRWIGEDRRRNTSMFLHPGSEFVQFDRTDYFVAVARSQSLERSCSQLHLVVVSTQRKPFRLVYVSDVLIFNRLEATTIRPGSIVNWTSNNDQLTFTITVDRNKSYLISIQGVGKLVQSIIEEQKTKLLDVGGHNADNYCRTLLRRQEKLVVMNRTVMRDLIDSPTYPSFRVASTTEGKDLYLWIAADRLLFGLIGRFLRDYELVYPQSRPGRNMMIDAGGNHGTYAFYGATLNQSVQIFEVLPKYSFIIEDSMRINSQWNGRILLHRFGVSDQWERWKILPDDGTTRLDYLLSNDDDDLVSTIRTAPLDDFIFQRISLLKIDVEGFEIRALKGAYRALKVFGVGAILIEIGPARWTWNNITIDQGINVLENITLTGHYSTYLIGRSDAACSNEIFSKFDGLVERKNLSMMSMSNGQLEFAPQVYQFFNWTSLIRTMNEKRWDCNFWLESDLTSRRRNSSENNIRRDERDD